MLTLLITVYLYCMYCLLQSACLVVFLICLYFFFIVSQM